MTAPPPPDAPAGPPAGVPPADLSEAEVRPPRRSFWRNLSPVWLVPLAAVAVSAFIAWQNWSDRGRLIRIHFQDGAGIIAGETAVRYREVAIGTVEAVDFTADLTGVIVSARITREVAETMGADSRFWVVRPVVSTRGISGLNTVLSGVYVEGAWTPTADSRVTDFQGLDAPPLVRPGREGTRVTLRSTDGALLSPGAPVYYRGIEVGSIDNPRISDEGDAVLADAFVLAPHDRFLTTQSRFWDTSGFTVKLGPAGLELDVASIGALIGGGIAFETVASGGAPVTDQTVFTLHADEAAARETEFDQLSADSVEMTVEFDESVRGLAAGAAVEYRGLKVGQVTAIGAVVVESGDRSAVRLRATVVIDPAALGLGEGGQERLLGFLEQAVAEGLRARLATASLFGAGLKIELAELPDAPPAALRRDGAGVPQLPSVPSDLPDFTATAQGALERINALPIEELLNQAIETLAAIEAVAGSEGLRTAPDEVVALIGEARAILGSDAAQALPGSLRDAVEELRAVVAELREQGTVAQLSSAIARADAALADVATAAQDFPELTQELRDLVAKAQGLEAEELVASARRMLDSADALIGTPEARAVPPALREALDQVRDALRELREGGAVANLNATLASARNAADSVAEAAEGMPALADRLDGVVARLDGLVAAYGARSDFNAQTLDALRQIQVAARAVAQLARTIERNPNSLLIGR